ncbi:MAG: cob(I)yrinic acid a,c-diamide adenosyltransferase [Elusimicrobiota bacterium]
MNNSKKNIRGLVQVYTGNGKGKTTAAVGSAIRALGQGLRVCFVQFFKNDKKFSYGEQKIFSQLKNLEFHCFSPHHPRLEKMVDDAEIRQGCRQGMEFIKNIFLRNNFDLLIIDELNIALRDGFLSPETVIGLLKNKPAKMEVIITGRGASKELMEYADLVTEMLPVKHPYDKGIPCRKGIEY